jgi:hypothetical protein
MASYKGIELDPGTKQRTGRQYELAAETRQAAVQELLTRLEQTPETVRIDPSRTLVQFDDQLWTIVGTTPATPSSESSSLRRGGAKHKHVR